MIYEPTVQIAKFICCREALVTVSYPDGELDDGSPRWSYLFGALASDEGVTGTLEEAWPQLWKDLNSRAAIIANKIEKQLEQHEGDAVLSLYYQSGNDALTEIADAFNAGEAHQFVFARFHKHDDNAKGVKKPGLADRRLLEAYVGRFAHYGDLSHYPFYDGDPHKVSKQWRQFPESIR